MGSPTIEAKVSSTKGIIMDIRKLLLSLIIIALLLQFTRSDYVDWSGYGSDDEDYYIDGKDA